MEECNFSKPNTSRLKDHLIKGKGKSFLLSKAVKGAIEFVPTVLQSLDRDFGTLWVDTVSIDSHDELIEEAKFCGKRPFLTRLIQQINFTYGNNCYDACAVLMRRLFEVLLVLSYQNNGIEADITKPDGSHKMLESIVKDAVQNKTLGVPVRISKNFDSFREVGNNSAHSITYTAGKLDIDNIVRDYRVIVKRFYQEGRRTAYSNNGVLLKYLVQKGYIMDAPTPEGAKRGNYYMVTSDGIAYIESYVPKEKQEEKKKPRPRITKTGLNVSEEYASITADDLNIKNYPAVKSLSGAKEQVIMTMYIVTNENKGEWFTVDEIIHLLVNVFDVPANTDMVNGVFKRNRSMFASEKAPNNKKAYRKKLLSGGKDFARNLIE